MQQVYSQYTKEDHEVWNILFNRQRTKIAEHASVRYNGALDQLSDIFYKERLPNYENLTKRLLEATGWRIEVVPGLIEIDQFYSLLAEKAFPASTWIRKRSQLDYLEEPDMFHDSFGHLPLLVERDFADFTHRLGLLGQKHSQNEKRLIELQRIYWYTLEFGLINENGIRKAYGAGLMSSGGEIEFAMSPKPEVLPFRIEEVIARPFDSMSIQELYFEITDFEDLHKALDDWEKTVD
ncbi:phenylalanine-4-hydroxylase [Cryomorphaceae bacterium]|nr:phenylalanine-4-hydroxylase [Cryomorphaceae bacterium]